MKTLLFFLWLTGRPIEPVSVPVVAFRITAPALPYEPAIFFKPNRDEPTRTQTGSKVR